jgi:RepB DNA-primase N-terminal domain
MDAWSAAESSPVVALESIRSINGSGKVDERYDADPSAADWRRFGRLPGFTNCTRLDSASSSYSFSFAHPNPLPYCDRTHKTESPVPAYRRIRAVGGRTITIKMLL